ncbi:MAG: hypothetical protein JW757_09415 [Anaerolineales bacterium]|nr:hypothetical protein [Anaerolineales bacterium]
MDKNLVEKISQKVYAKFPEVKGKKPTIKTSKTVSSDQGNFVLTYNAVAKDIRGREIPRHIRVVATAQGKIIKMSTSR